MDRNSILAFALSMLVFTGWAMWQAQRFPALEETPDASRPPIEGVANPPGAVLERRPATLELPPLSGNTMSLPSSQVTPHSTVSQHAHPTGFARPAKVLEGHHDPAFEMRVSLRMRYRTNERSQLDD